jgi:hypothetical protein
MMILFYNCIGLLHLFFKAFMTLSKKSYTIFPVFVYLLQGTALPFGTTRRRRKHGGRPSRATNLFAQLADEGRMVGDQVGQLTFLHSSQTKDPWWEASCLAK